MPETATPPKPHVVPAMDGQPVAKPTSKRRLPFIILGVLLLVGGTAAYRTWSFNQTHASTDDSQVAADSVDIAAQVGATVAKVYVADNQQVKRGDLLFQLDDRSFVTAVEQARANLDAAIAQAKGAGVATSLTQQTGDAQVAQAEGVLGQATSGISSARAGIAGANAGIAGARAGQSAAKAAIAAAKSSIANARAMQAKAVAALTGARATVGTAQAQVRAADAAVDTAKSNSDLAAKEAARYANLVSQGAVSQQEADAKADAAVTAAANLNAAQQQAAAARSTLALRESDITAAQDAVSAATAGISQARAQAQASQSQSSASDAAYEQALAQRRASSDAVRAAEAKAAQAQGQLQQALSVGKQVDVSRTSQLQSAAKVEQARAALAEAQLQLSYTKIYAPRDGRVTKKAVDAGQLVQPGSPLCVIVDEGDIWVVSNYKETQMPGIAPGKKVDIEVDAVPGHTFRGTVNSVQAGTGATFALLPPDNSTGNFTKVVQRIPVKIVFDPGQPDLDKLRAGMSTSTVVDL